MKVLFCSSEVAPFAKTGGLADVAGALPKALGRLGVEVLVAMPRYRGVPAGIHALSANARVVFIENEEYFNRASLYGNEAGDYSDNLKRFNYFCRESLAQCRSLGFSPDIVHANDWQTAPLAVLLKHQDISDPFFHKSKCVLTIHNLAFQGVFPGWEYDSMGLPSTYFGPDGFEYYGKVNFLKAGILYCDALTTVSPRYAEEITTKEYGCGLEEVVSLKFPPVRGILNGLDVHIFDPNTDPNLPAHYSADLIEGKQVCKASLQKNCGFEIDPDIPVYGLVSRLAHQKGLDILLDALDSMMTQKLQFVLLGDGDEVYKRALTKLQVKYPDNLKIHLGFSVTSASQIYAGIDFFLMPSLFEPCGLGQMIALRYGALPVARSTGGLVDTIRDIDKSTDGNGFLFEDESSDEFLNAIERSLVFYGHKKRLQAVRQEAMKVDYSWDKSAQEYLDFYKEIIAS